MKKSILLLIIILLLVGCEKENTVTCSGYINYEGEETKTTFTGYFDNDDKLYDATVILDFSSEETKKEYCVLAEIVDTDDLYCEDGLFMIKNYPKYFFDVNDESIIGFDKMNFEAMLEEALKGKFTCTK